MTARSFIGSPSFFQVIFTVASLTLQVKLSLSPVAIIDCEFDVIRAKGFSVLRKRKLAI